MRKTEDGPGVRQLELTPYCPHHPSPFSAGPGGRNDGQHYAYFQIYNQLAALSAATNALLGTAFQWYTFTDGAFPASFHLRKGFINPAPGGNLAAFNHAANAGGRVTVEHGFHCQIAQFPFADTYRKMKVSQQNYRDIYAGVAMFHNIHCSVYGNQVGAYCEVRPPTLEKLFAVMRLPV